MERYAEKSDNIIIKLELLRKERKRMKEETIIELEANELEGLCACGCACGGTHPRQGSGMGGAED